ncbi:MAG: hypothetical protein ACE5I4_03000 [Thermoplasmata archaeon]
MRPYESNVGSRPGLKRIFFEHVKLLLDPLSDWARESPKLSLPLLGNKNDKLFRHKIRPRGFLEFVQRDELFRFEDSAFPLIENPQLPILDEAAEKLVVCLSLQSEAFQTVADLL